MNLLVLLSVVAAAASPAASPIASPAAPSATSSTDVPSQHAEQIFPPVAVQTHAPGIVECPNGDLLASWYGDRPQSDSAVFGARRKRGETNWSPPFVLADRPGFPDCNTCLMIDRQQRLWLFWPTIVADSWETCLLNFRVAADYAQPGRPKWDREGLILLKPENFRDEALRLLGNRPLRPPRGAKGGPEGQRAKLGESLYQRLGWAPRCKPTILPSGRILLPLYTDTFSISIMAVSDDNGSTWYASQPLIGFGNIQPTVLRRNDGTLVAYMRENGPSHHIRVAESPDDGLKWGPVGETPLPNPGSGIDAVRLANGHWVLIYNDSASSRANLAVSVSDDEGRTWKATRHLERHAAGSYHYPALIQGHDGTLHAIYSSFIVSDAPVIKAGDKRKRAASITKGIKHAAFNEAWIRLGD
jgi:predicted neuraminidase